MPKRWNTKWPWVKDLLYLPFFEGSGDVAHDTSGHSHDAVLHNTMWGISQRKISEILQPRDGIYFRGSDSYAQVADAPELNPEADFSIEAYICPTFPSGTWWQTQGSIAIKGVSDWPRPGWEIRGRPDNAIFIPFYSYFQHSYGLPGGEGFQYLNTISFPAGQWSRIKFEVLPSLGETRGYVNGELRAVAKYPKGLSNLTSPGFPLYMGVAAGGGGGYCGFIDEFKIRLI